ncbi:MAG: hypothetical protein ACLQLC_15325 [Candidatus Sulfotelmatobacter sp.]
MHDAAERSTRQSRGQCPRREPATARVFAFNGDSNSATAIQAADGKVAGTVDLSGGPEYAVADGSGYIYNNLEDASVVLTINARSLKVEQWRWILKPTDFFCRRRRLDSLKC